MDWGRAWLASAGQAASFLKGKHGCNHHAFSVPDQHKGRFKLVRVKLVDGGITSSGTSAQGSGAKRVMGGSPGIIKAISLAYTSSNASGVVTIKETYSSGATLFAYTGDTNTTGATTGQMLMTATDGLTVTNGLSADVEGIYFARGLYLSYASATVGDSVIVKLLIDTQVQYVARTMNCVGTNGNAAATSAVYFDRPGRIVGIRVGASAASTADFTIKADSDVNASGVPGSNAGATIFTATNFGTTAIASAAGTLCPAPLVGGAVDEAGGAVTVGRGLPFLHGFTAALAQCNSGEAIVAEFWVEV